MRRSCANALFVSIVLTGLVSAVTSNLASLAATSHRGPRLQVVEQNDQHRVQFRVDSRVMVSAPPEGLWSIATSWDRGAPVAWHHAHPRRVETVGEWTILHGELALPEGTWHLRDAYRVEGGAVRCTRRFTWTGAAPLPETTLSVRFRVPTTRPRYLLPGIMYYGNPSGIASQTADRRPEEVRVPIIGTDDGDRGFYEEHRYPVPYACIEWDGADGAIDGAALHSLPSPVPSGNLDDQWWSLGVQRRGDVTELGLYSGYVATNGRDSVVKALQRGLLPYDAAYVNVRPGQTIEKTFWIEAYPVASEGSGFRRPLWTAIDRHLPHQSAGYPAPEDTLRHKVRLAMSRWRTGNNGAAGFSMYPDRDEIVMGWCGQAAAPGYALPVLADTMGAAIGLAPDKAEHMACQSLSFLTTAPLRDDGIAIRYDIGEAKWLDRTDFLSQGQGMWNLVRAYRRLGETTHRERETKKRLAQFLRHACDYHAARILDEAWYPHSTNEGFLIAPLAIAATVLDDPAPQYGRAALKAADHYLARHVSMRQPYWGGTLDARCEDKEGAFAALQGFLAAYDLTGDRKYLDAARHACDVVLTYLVVWDIDMPPGRLRDHAFRTTGWTAVSVQNQHIDAYGVLITPDIYRLGVLLEDRRLTRLAMLMFHSCGQLVDPYGSQGEQPQHTNYSQHRHHIEKGLASFRGDYVESWTVFWLTAHFLNAAAQLIEEGADLNAVP